MIAQTFSTLRRFAPELPAARNIYTALAVLLNVVTWHGQAAPHPALQSAAAWSLTPGETAQVCRGALPGLFCSDQAGTGAALAWALRPPARFRRGRLRSPFGSLGLV